MLLPAHRIGVGSDVPHNGTETGRLSEDPRVVGVRNGIMGETKNRHTMWRGHWLPLMLCETLQQV